MQFNKPVALYVVAVHAIVKGSRRNVHKPDTWLLRYPYMLLQNHRCISICLLFMHTARLKVFIVFDNV